jgi:hypothetical protein
VGGAAGESEGVSAVQVSFRWGAEVSNTPRGESMKAAMMLYEEADIDGIENLILRAEKAERERDELVEKLTGVVPCSYCGKTYTSLRAENERLKAEREIINGELAVRCGTCNFTEVMDENRKVRVENERLRELLKKMTGTISDGFGNSWDAKSRWGIWK